MRIINSYIPPTAKLEFNDFKPIFDIAQKRLLVMGDFNDHNVLWGSDKCNKKGNNIE